MCEYSSLPGTWYFERINKDQRLLRDMHWQGFTSDADREVSTPATRFVVDD